MAVSFSAMVAFIGVMAASISIMAVSIGAMAASIGRSCLNSLSMALGQPYSRNPTKLDIMLTCQSSHSLRSPANYWLVTPTDS